MRVLVFTLCAAMVAVMGNGAWAQDEGATDQADRRAEFRQRMLEEFDTDGDGVLSDEERAAMMEAMRERRARGEGPQGPARPINYERLFNAFDEDNDGKLSKDEFTNLTEAVRARMAAASPEGERPAAVERGEGRRPRGEGRGERPGEGRRPRGEGRAEGSEDRPGPPAGRRGGGRPGGEGRGGEAAGERRGPGAGGFGMLNAERLFNRFDEDSDGYLSRDEYNQYAEFMTSMRGRMLERGGPRGEAEEGSARPPRGEGRGRGGRPQRPPQDE